MPGRPPICSWGRRGCGCVWPPRGCPINTEATPPGWGAAFLSPHQPPSPPAAMHPFRRPESGIPAFSGVTCSQLSSIAPRACASCPVGSPQGNVPCVLVSGGLSSLPCRSEVCALLLRAICPPRAVPSLWPRPGQSVAGDRLCRFIPAQQVELLSCLPPPLPHLFAFLFHVQGHP